MVGWWWLAQLAVDLEHLGPWQVGGAAHLLDHGGHHPLTQPRVPPDSPWNVDGVCTLNGENPWSMEGDRRVQSWQAPCPLNSKGSI